MKIKVKYIVFSVTDTGKDEVGSTMARSEKEALRNLKYRIGAVEFSLLGRNLVAELASEVAKNKVRPQIDAGSQRTKSLASRVLPEGAILQQTFDFMRA